MELKPREKKCSFHLQISFNEAEHKHVKNRKEKNGFIKRKIYCMWTPSLESGGGAAEKDRSARRGAQLTPLADVTFWQHPLTHTTSWKLQAFGC